MDQTTVITGATLGAVLLLTLYMRQRNQRPPVYGERHVPHDRPISTSGFTNPAYGESYGAPIPGIFTKPLLSVPSDDTDTPLSDPSDAVTDTGSTPTGGSRIVPESGSGSGGSNRVNVATYNVLHETTVGQTWNALQKLISKNADVIGLNEFASKFDSLGRMLESKGWGLYSPRGVNAVAWDDKRFEKIDSGMYALNKRTMIENKVSGRVTRQWVERYAAWVKLRDRKTGREFYEVSAHLISDIEGKGSPERKRVAREQVGNLAALTRQLAAKDRNVPVFVTGDMNLDEDVSRKGILAPLYGMNFRNNWDWLGTKGMGNGTFGRRFIDWLWSRGKVTLTDQRVIEGLPSDHDALIGSYRLG